MGEVNNFLNERLEFREIVLSHLKAILQISTHELRDNSRVVTHTNFDERIQQEDTRISYIQAIENLAYILLPYFDDEMEKIYSKCISVINGYDFQIKKMFNDEINAICKDKGTSNINIEFYFVTKKIEFAKKLFVELNKLLRRNDYLKGAVYGESDEEIIEEKEEGEKE